MTMFNQAGQTNPNPPQLETVPYYQTREEDPSLQFVEVFMVNNDNSGTGVKQAGHIYTVRQYEADAMAGKGTATTINVAPLKLTQGKMDNLTKQLQDAADKIKNNDRLSDIGKREELQLLVGQYEATADSLQAQYENDVEVLKQAELSRAQLFSGTSKIDPHEVRTQAGLLKAASSVAPNVEQSVQTIISKLPSLDIAVARELLSQFSDIKRDIEAKKTGTSVQANANSSRLIRELYAALETASTTPEQTKANTKYKMLDAISRERGDIRTNFRNTTRALRRY